MHAAASGRPGAAGLTLAEQTGLACRRWRSLGAACVPSKPVSGRFPSAADLQNKCSYDIWRNASTLVVVARAEHAPFSNSWQDSPRTATFGRPCEVSAPCNGAGVPSRAGRRRRGKAVCFSRLSCFGPRPCASPGPPSARGGQWATRIVAVRDGPGPAAPGRSRGRPGGGQQNHSLRRPGRAPSADRRPGRSCDPWGGRPATQSGPSTGSVQGSSGGCAAASAGGRHCRFPDLPPRLGSARSRPGRRPSCPTARFSAGSAWGGHHTAVASLLRFTLCAEPRSHPPS